jgi:arylsulfatase A-like enzyme
VPTVLGRLNIKPPARATGEDLWPYITNEKTNQRKAAISSYGYIASVRTPEWNYSVVWNKDKYQGSYKPQLYDLKNDPEELQSVADQHPQVQSELQAILDEYIASGKDLTDGSFSQELS